MKFSIRNIRTPVSRKSCHECAHQSHDHRWHAAGDYRLSRVIAVVETVTQHVLVLTGQNYDYELNGIFFKDWGCRSPGII
jgi:vacuolar-type H+-ATPase subunit C/Vma6